MLTASSPVLTAINPGRRKVWMQFFSSMHTFNAIGRIMILLITAIELAGYDGSQGSDAILLLYLGPSMNKTGTFLIMHHESCTV